MRRFGRGAAAAALATVVGASASWASPGDPVPVRDDPNVVETAPSAQRGWFGWSQNSAANPDHLNFFVQPAGGDRIRVNAPRTQGLGGDKVGGAVFYVQQYGDRPPRINRYDLSSGLRSPLPPKVNHWRHTVRPYIGTEPNRVLTGVRGDVTSSGPWLLYSGYMRFLDFEDFVYPHDTVVLYNRRTQRLRLVETKSDEDYDLEAGQVNGSFVAYLETDNFSDGETPTVAYRHNLQTGRTVSFAPGEQFLRQSAPSVSSDGTVYYFETALDCTSPCTHELVRRPIGGPAEVIASVSTPEWWQRPERTYVKDRPDGSRVVLFSVNEDIYEVVDDPAAPAQAGS